MMLKEPLLWIFQEKIICLKIFAVSNLPSPMFVNVPLLYEPSTRLKDYYYL